ncbi:MAG: C69 family dipeptidase [Anaerolineae bacterium]|nr:C69 family dipeptidase [Anaerolineae bacterium]
MCDTLVALGSATADGITLFAKNSDREPNEAHHLLRVPRAHHPAGSTVTCTYLTIPQARTTYEVLLAKPFWIWGAEMGANEHGVAIGNEAVFTRVPYEKQAGLLGMDLLRLGLERARTAREALDVITGLLAEYSQGGNSGFRHKFYYHNSFLIADPRDAWVLETAGRHWAAEQVRDVRAISNGLTIGTRWDLASDDLVSYAVERGWCRGRDDFHFANCYSDTLYTRLSACRYRRATTEQALRSQIGALTVPAMIAALRSHGAAPYNPAAGLTGAEVCMHAAFGPVRASQTVGSMVSSLAPDVQTHFVTGTAAPCTSVFKPVWLGADLDLFGPIPDGRYDEATLFWRHEALHRATLRNYPALAPLYQPERDALEQRIIPAALAFRHTAPEDRVAFASRCFAEAAAAEARWRADVEAAPVSGSPGLLYRRAWQARNRAAGMPHESS